MFSIAVFLGLAMASLTQAPSKADYITNYCWKHQSSSYLSCVEQQKEYFNYAVAYAALAEGLGFGKAKDVLTSCTNVKDASKGWLLTQHCVYELIKRKHFEQCSKNRVSNTMEVESR